MKNIKRRACAMFMGASIATAVFCASYAETNNPSVLPDEVTVADVDALDDKMNPDILNEMFQDQDRYSPKDFVNEYIQRDPAFAKIAKKYFESK